MGTSALRSNATSSPKSCSLLAHRFARTGSPIGNSGRSCSQRVPRTRSAPTCRGSQPANAYQNGIVFFPGSLPLYKNGVLVGGLGVSGDGVEQDDFATAAGAAGFEAAPSIRADQIIDQGVRLPYLKFPRNPVD